MAQEDREFRISSDQLVPDLTNLRGDNLVYRDDGGIGHIEGGKTEAGVAVSFGVLPDTGLGDELRADPSKVSILQPWPCHPDVCQCSLTSDDDAVTVTVRFDSRDEVFFDVTHFLANMRGLIKSAAPIIEVAEHNARAVLHKMRIEMQRTNDGH